jgi:hypothetical protein
VAHGFLTFDGMDTYERRRPVGRDDKLIAAPQMLTTSNRPIEDWPKLFGDTEAVTALLDRLYPWALSVTGFACHQAAWLRTASGH